MWIDICRCNCSTGSSKVRKVYNILQDYCSNFDNINWYKSLCQIAWHIVNKGSANLLYNLWFEFSNDNIAAKFDNADDYVEFLNNYKYEKISKLIARIEQVLSER